MYNIHDENIKSIHLDLFQHGTFTSHSGLKLNWKIECDALSSKEWDCLAIMIMEREPTPFYRAEGIPRGGLPLATALNKFATNNKDDRVLICDDVWTTGGSFKEYIGKHYPRSNRLIKQELKWVVFSRYSYQSITTDGVKALFTMR